MQKLNEDIFFPERRRKYVKGSRGATAVKVGLHLFYFIFGPEHLIFGPEHRSLGFG